MMTVSRKTFFIETQKINEQMGDFLNFTWASYAGLREMWWQVKGFTHCFPDMNNKVLKEKFLTGLEIPGGIDLESVCLSQGWDEHVHRFSKSLIFEACTMYEAWAEKICEYVLPGDDTARKSLQFPTTNGSNGYMKAIIKVNSNPSTFIKNNFFGIVSSNNMNRWARINDFLIMYRYFKEIRNSFIHGSGNVNQEIMDCFSQVESMHNHRGQLTKFPINLSQPTLDSEINISIRDSVIFYSYIKYIIITFDAALCVSLNSEDYMSHRIKNYINSNKKQVYYIPHDTAKKERVVKKILLGSSFPFGSSMTPIFNWLVQRNLVIS
ncbi:hypothetical protein P2G56_14715 [Cronobacter malonaticus]|nr:hypothetical protein [Cronobacter malonaticus]